MITSQLCRNWLPLLPGATLLCLAAGGGQAEAACVNPPAIGWPEGKIAAVTAQTPDLLEIQYHDQCSGEASTRVSIRQQGHPSSAVIKTEGFNQGGWRKASRAGLIADTPYQFLVEVKGSDGVIRSVSRTVNTLKDPACPMRAPVIGRPVAAPPSRPSNPFEPEPPPLPNLPTAKRITQDSIEIEYDDLCAGEPFTRVLVRARDVGGEFQLVKSDHFNSSGFRSATATGLAPRTAYEVKVSVLGTDHKLREAVATFHTHAATIPPKPQIAAVVLGDSFSSGEGGRWSGNGDLVQRSADPTLGGTDRAGHVDLKFIYEAKSVDNLCHRSTAAPVTYLRDLRFQDRFDRVFNLACSGARVKHLWPASEGGEAFRGEAPQITQLGQLAAQHDIKLIVVGIGGNDMGFSDVIGECVIAWVTKHMTFVDSASCIGALESDMLRRIDEVQPKIARTIELIRKEMSARKRADYQIVLMGYPNIIPDFHGFKYAAGDRRLKRCPFNGADAQWIDDRLLPALNGMMATAAREAGVSFVSLENAFDGHRLCQGGTTRPVNLRFVTDQEAEWVRFIDYDTSAKLDYLAKVALWKRFYTPGIVLGPSIINELKQADQGDLQESLHPNHFGQQAVGTCLRQFWSQFGVKGSPPQSLTCRNGPSRRATDMVLQVLPAPTTTAQLGTGIQHAAVEAD